MPSKDRFRVTDPPKVLELRLQVLLRRTRWLCENGDETVAMSMGVAGAGRPLRRDW